MTASVRAKCFGTRIDSKLEGRERSVPLTGKQTTGATRITLLGLRRDGIERSVWVVSRPRRTDWVILLDSNYRLWHAG